MVDVVLNACFASERVAQAVNGFDLQFLGRGQLYQAHQATTLDFLVGSVCFCFECERGVSPVATVVHRQTTPTVGGINALPKGRVYSLPLSVVGIFAPLLFKSLFRVFAHPPFVRINGFAWVLRVSFPRLFISCTTALFACAAAVKCSPLGNPRSLAGRPSEVVREPLTLSFLACDDVHDSR